MKARTIALVLAAAMASIVLPARAHPGIGIVQDAKGSVFYTDLAKVWKIDASGTKTVAVPNVHTHELFLDHEGNLYGEHVWYEGDATKKWGYRVWKRTPEGHVTDVVPARVGFRTDYSFVRDAAGAMYWVDVEVRTAIHKKAADGTGSDACPGCDFHDIMWMTAAPDGTLFVEDEADLVRVGPDKKRFTLAPALAGRARTQAQVQDRHRLMGLWLDSAGNLYVASYGTREVKKVTQGGQVTVVARSSFPWSPTGGLIASNGDLWLLECSLTNAVRVRRIAKDGTSKTF